jgi:hypothetical protein
MKKVNCMTRLYLWLNKNFTEQILFKNRENQLNALFDSHCKGEIFIPTELEAIMEDEVLQMIQHKFDNKEGLKEL